MKKMNLKANEAIAIGGLAFIELLSSKANNEELHIFLSPSVTTKKINLAKNIDKTITMYLSNKTIYPKSLVVRELKDLDVYEIDVSESGDRSIGIEGLGWVSFLGHKQQFRIYVPKGIAVYTGRSKVLTYGIKSKK